MITEIFSKRQYPKSTQTFGPVAVPIGMMKVAIKVDRLDLTDAAVGLSWSIMLSLDAGLSWRPWGGAGTVGGIVLNGKTGLPEPESSLVVDLPEPANPDRQIE